MMPPNDPTDAKSTPPDVRWEAFTAALMALERVIGERGFYLDLFGRLELLDVMLDEADARFDAQMSEPEIVQ